MSDDRELLELAARAAGYHLVWLDSVDELHRLRTQRPYLRPASTWNRRASDCTPWNPLVDDGDALRLAVALGLVVDCSRPSAALPFTRHSYDLSEGGNNAAATRRAIVRAAAEIGRDTP